MKTLYESNEPGTIYVDRNVPQRFAYWEGFESLLKFLTYAEVII